LVKKTAGDVSVIASMKTLLKYRNDAVKAAPMGGHGHCAPGMVE